MSTTLEAGGISGIAWKTHDDAVREARRLLDAVIEGRLHERAAAGQFEGGNREILQAFNGVRDAVEDPLNLAATYVDRISKGDIPARITDDFQGEFQTL